MRLRAPAGKTLRDIGSFVVGATGLIYEAISQGAERPTLIIAFAGLMGLPLFVRTDEKPPPPPVQQPVAPPALPPGSGP